MIRKFLELIAENVKLMACAAFALPLLAVLGGGVGGVLLAVLLVLLDVLAVMGVRELCRREGMTFSQLCQQQQAENQRRAIEAEWAERNSMVLGLFNAVVNDRFGGLKPDDTNRLTFAGAAGDAGGCRIAFFMNALKPDSDEVSAVQRLVKQNLVRAGYAPDAFIIRTEFLSNANQIVYVIRWKIPSARGDTLR